MKRLLTYAFIIIASLQYANAEKYEVNLGEFTHLKVDDYVNVVYSNNPDSVGMAHYETTPDKANAILFTKDNKNLKIQVATSESMHRGLPTVYVYSSFLTKAENDADSTLRIARNTPVPEIEIINSGNGKIIARNIETQKAKVHIITGKGTIIVSGNCNEADLKNVGTGELQADELQAKEVKCVIFGTGHIGCNATKKLNVRGTGTGKVYYKGNPKEVKVRKIGSVKAIPIEENK